jgi:hypothetical protein
MQYVTPGYQRDVSSLETSTSRPSRKVRHSELSTLFVTLMLIMLSQNRLARLVTAFEELERCCGAASGDGPGSKWETVSGVSTREKDERGDAE